MSDDVNLAPPTKTTPHAATAAAYAQVEAKKEIVRTRQMTIVGGTGAVSAFQIIEKAQELAVTWWPSQPHTLWELMGMMVLFFLAGGFNNLARRNEL